MKEKWFLRILAKRDTLENLYGLIKRLNISHEVVSTRHSEAN